MFFNDASIRPKALGDSGPPSEMARLEVATPRAGMGL